MLMQGDLETRAQRYGHEILDRLGHARPVPFSPAWLDERLMGASMADEAVKIQLFRFVDVLPRPHSPASITGHLRQSFGAANGRVPGWLTLALRWLPSNGLLSRLLAGFVQKSARRLARKFIAGSNLDEALGPSACCAGTPLRSPRTSSARAPSPRPWPTSTRRATSTSSPALAGPSTPGRPTT
jgi:hypothetical protein